MKPTPECAAVLEVVRSSPGISRGEIAKRVGKTPNATGRLLYRLQQIALCRATGVGRYSQWEPA